MIDPGFVFLGAVLSLVGSGRHAWLTARGRTRPNRVSWFLWAAVPIVGFLAQLDEGVGLPAVMTLSIGLGPAAVFAASFISPRGVWRVGRFDLACGGLAVVALLVWWGLDAPAWAVLVAVVADAAAAIPTIRKAWIAPETEGVTVYALSGLNAVITLLTVTEWSPAVYAFPVYVLTLTGVLVALVVVGRNKRHRIESA